LECRVFKMIRKAGRTTLARPFFVNRKLTVPFAK
jgi:hypothetical protein